MSQPAESFCAAMNEVTCPVCPIRQITEPEWVEAAGPDKTPEDAAADIGHVGVELTEEPGDRRERAAADSYAIDGDDQYDDTDGQPLRRLSEDDGADLELDDDVAAAMAELRRNGGVLAVETDEDVVGNDVLAGMLLDTRGWPDTYVGGDAEPGPVASAVGACAAKFVDRSCGSLDESVIEGLRGRTPGLGADTLSRTGLTGTDHEVMRTAGRLKAWAAEHGLSLTIEDDASVAAVRAYMVRLASAVRTDLT
jgi:hypothetical protein